MGEAPDDSLPERALHYIYEHIQRFYNFKGLHAFKEKFHPHWESRYLVFPNMTDLPAVALALIRADSEVALHNSELKQYAIRDLA